MLLRLAVTTPVPDATNNAPSRPLRRGAGAQCDRDICPATRGRRNARCESRVSF